MPSWVFNGALAPKPAIWPLSIELTGLTRNGRSLPSERWRVCPFRTAHNAAEISTCRPKLLSSWGRQVLRSSMLLHKSARRSALSSGGMP